ncbi:MAG: hypothetical protein ACLR7D_05935 [Lachnospira eligens]
MVKQNNTDAIKLNVNVYVNDMGNYIWYQHFIVGRLQVDYINCCEL